MTENDPKLTFSADAVMSSSIAGHAEHKREDVELSERANQVPRNLQQMPSLLWLSLVL